MIKAEQLTTRYGDLLAVDELSFNIDDGHITASSDRRKQKRLINKLLTLFSFEFQV